MQTLPDRTNTHPYSTFFAHILTFEVELFNNCFFTTLYFFSIAINNVPWMLSYREISLCYILKGAACKWKDQQKLEKKII